MMATETNKKLFQFSNLKTIVCFNLFCSTLPFLFFSYIVTSIFNRLWCGLLSLRYPKLDIIRKESIRTRLDTQHNLSIVHMVIQLEGKCDLENVKTKFNDLVVNRCRDPNNEDSDLLYPRLKQRLIACFGYYAWDKESTGLFDIDEQIIEYPTHFRGRPINETNIQDCISTIVLKYFPIKGPQWQLILIPSVNSINQQPICYLLLRMHHLYLTEQPEFDLNTILLTNYQIELRNNVENSTTSSSTTTTMTYNNNNNNSAIVINQTQRSSSSSPALLTNILKPLIHIPKLYDSLSITLNNHWNELIYKSVKFESGEPLLDGGGADNGDGLVIVKNKNNKKTTVDDNNNSFGHIISAILIIAITIGREFFKFDLLKKDSGNTASISGAGGSPHKLPTLTVKNIINLIIKCFHPINLFYCTLNFWYTIVHGMIVTLPLTIWYEIIGFIHYFYGTDYSLWKNSWSMMCINILFELVYLAEIIAAWPKQIFEQLIERRSHEENPLQKQSMCGRKVISWSKSVDISDIQKLCKKYISPTGSYNNRKRITTIDNSNEINETDICFAAIAESFQHLLDYCNDEHSVGDEEEMADHCTVLARSVPHDYISGGKETQGNIGYICLNLPLNTDRKSRILQTHRQINEACENQYAFYAIQTSGGGIGIVGGGGGNGNGSYSGVSGTKYADSMVKLLPATVFKILFNYLSRKFSITITQMESKSENILKQTIWGQRVQDVIYFNSPQSNIGISLTLQTIGNRVRVSAITDAQFSPHHKKLTDIWTTFFNEQTE